MVFDKIPEIYQIKLGEEISKMIDSRDPDLTDPSEEITPQFYQAFKRVNDKMEIFPTVLADIIISYFTVVLSKEDKYKMTLIVFGSFLKLPIRFQMSSRDLLPKVVQNMYITATGLEIENKFYPKFNQNMNENFEKMKDALESAGKKTHPRALRDSVHSNLVFKNLFDSQIHSEGEDSVLRHVPFQLPLGLQKTKEQKLLYVMEQKNYDDKLVAQYLGICFHLEKANQFYKHVGFLDVGIVTIYLNKNMVKKIHEDVLKNKGKEFLERKAHIFALRCSLNTYKDIHCRHVEFNEEKGYIAIMPLESAKVLLKIPGVLEAYEHPQRVGRSLTVQDWKTPIEHFSKQKEIQPLSRAALLNLLETMIVNLCRLSDDALLEIATMFGSNNRKEHSITKFLKALPIKESYMGLGLMSKRVNVCDMVFPFMHERVLEVSQIRGKIATDLPHLTLT